MTDTIEVNERPLTPEEIQRDYVNIKGAAQIFGDVSEKTARRYLSSDHRVIVNSIEKIVNGGVGKLYRKADVIAVAEVLKVIPSVVQYEAVTVRHTEANPQLPTESVSNAISLSDRECLLVSTAVRECLQQRVSHRTNSSTLFVGLLIILCIAFFLYESIKKDRISMVSKIDRQSRQIVSLKSFIAHKKI